MRGSMGRWYRDRLCKATAYFVDFKGGQNFGERQDSLFR